MQASDRSAEWPAFLGQLRTSFASPFGARAQRVVDRWFPRQSLHTELIATLNEVADAVSSAMDLSEVLLAITERVKRVIESDKAVIILTDEHTDELDFETLTVKGRRDQHSQDWWESRIIELGAQSFATGEPVTERYREQNAILVCSPLLAKDVPIGLLCAINSLDRPFTRTQIEFIAIVSAFAAASVENARLGEQTRYVLLASERDRIAREMHDGVVQSLFSISLGLEVCKKQIHRDPSAAFGRLDELQEHLNMSMSELRRFIYDLRPMKLAELGLVGAMEYWVREVTLGRPVRGRVTVNGDVPRLRPAEEACLYRVTKESVSNIVRHSNARSFEVRLTFESHRAELEIVDDGDGFDSDAVLDAADDGRIGIRSIRQQVDREGGQLILESTPGHGTVVKVGLPIEGTA